MAKMARDGAPMLKALGDQEALGDLGVLAGQGGIDGLA